MNRTFDVAHLGYRNRSVGTIIDHTRQDKSDLVYHAVGCSERESGISPLLDREEAD